MWVLIAFVSSNILWFLIGVFVGGCLTGYTKIKEEHKDKEEDTDEVQSTKS